MFPARKPGQGNGIFGNYRPNMGMVLGGIARMSGDKNTGAFDQMAAQFEQQRAQKKKLDQMMADPQFRASVPKEILGMLPYMSPQAAAQVATNYKLQSLKQQRAEANRVAQFGKTGQIFQGKDGRFYTVQFSSNGERRITPLDEGMTPSRGVGTVDTGTGTQIIDKSTGAPVRRVDKDIAGAEGEKVQGKRRADAALDLPKAIGDAEEMLRSIKVIREHPNRDIATGNSSMLPTVRPSTRDFYAMVKQLRGQVFLQAFQSLKGAGQITENETRQAVEAKSRLDTSQSEEGFLRALSDLERIVKRAVQRARAAGGKSGGSQPAKRRLRYNPRTGELE